MLSVVITDTNFPAGFISSPILSLLMSDQGIACGYPFCVRCHLFLLQETREVEDTHFFLVEEFAILMVYKTNEEIFES